jgi:nitroreductase
MDLKQAIYTRRAIRAYKPEPVDESVIRAVIDAAIQAPSAINQQPWAFAVIRDKTLLATISREAKAYMLKVTPPEHLPPRFKQVLNDPTFDIFHNAPVLIVISAPTEAPWTVEDCALAAENLMLAAHGLGLGTCWIGFAQAWLGTHEGRSALRLPAGHSPYAPIILGYPSAAAPPIPRKTPEINWIG